ncbi:MAG TPA: hypothetical protein VKA68_11600, partial [bacterium]|nr:hypothetical protein [bacterium]
MPFPPEPHPKNPGDLIKSADWNTTIEEIQRIADEKLDRAGDTVTGSLTIDGSLGVGTTSPSQKLQVTGTIHSTRDGFKFPDGTVQNTAWSGKGNTLDQAYHQGGAGAGRTITADNGPVSIVGSGGLTVTGKVGIGVESPEARLHVSGGDTPGQYANTSATLEIDNAGSNTSILQANGPAAPYRINIQDGFGRVSHLWNAYSAYDPNQHQYDVENEGANWLRMHTGEYSFFGAKGATKDGKIDWQLGIHQNAEGAVGIGTESPGEKLEIAGNMKLSGNALIGGNAEIKTTNAFLDFGSNTRQMINLWGNSPNASYGIGVQGYTQYFRSDGNFAWYIKGSHHDGELNAGGGTAALVIKRPDGKVGIGTESPEGTLHIASGSDVAPGGGGFLILGSTKGANVAIDNNEIMSRNNGQPSTLYFQADGGRIGIHTNKPESTQVHILDNGRVGIGENSPNAHLHVPNGGILNGLAIGVEPPGGTNFKWDYETLGTISTGHNLRLHSYNAVYLHSGNRATPSLSVLQNGQVTGNFGFGFSSKEKKKAIKSLSIDEAFGLFNDLKPVKFEYKKGEG